MQHQVSGRGFTTSYGTISNTLKTPIEIQHSNGETKHSFTAIWDTGATHSVISERVVIDCNLKPTGGTFVDGISGRFLTPTFIVNLFLPNEVLVPDVTVTLMSQYADFDMLVGMDIINLGSFAISNYDNNTTFSFRMPSIEQIDFKT